MPKVNECFTAKRDFSKWLTVNIKYSITIKELAEKMRMSSVTLYGRLRNPGTISLDEASKIVKYAKIDKQEFFDRYGKYMVNA